MILMMDSKARIIVPIDTNDIDQALKTVNTLRPHVGMFKFGLELLNSIIAQLAKTDDISLLQKVQCLFALVDGQLFWDGKWDDIPNTVKGAAKAITAINPMMVNVHASAGIQSVKAAIENSPDCLVLGVTVLTSISPDECFSIFGDYPNNKVVEFATSLIQASADGIVCSPQELIALNEQIGGPRFPLVTVIPGIRPSWAATGDQKRVMTPREAIDAGADYLVIGRPITNPPPEIGTPIDAVNKIIEEMEA